MSERRQGMPRNFTKEGYSEQYHGRLRSDVMEQVRKIATVQQRSVTLVINTALAEYALRHEGEALQYDQMPTLYGPLRRTNSAD